MDSPKRRSSTSRPLSWVSSVVDVLAGYSLVQFTSDALGSPWYSTFKSTFVSIQHPKDNLELHLMMHAIKAANKCFKDLAPAKQGEENVRNAIADLTLIVALLDLSNPSLKAFDLLDEMLRYRLQTVYKMQLQTGLKIAMVVLRYIHDEKVVPLQSNDQRFQQWQDLICSILSGVLDYIYKYNNNEVREAVAAATSASLSRYFLTDPSKDQPPYSSHLLSIVYQLSVEILDSTEPAVLKLRESISSHILGQHIAKSKDVLALKAILDLLGKLFPSNKSGRDKQNEFLKEVFNPKFFEPSDRILQPFRIINMDWRVTASKIITNLAASYLSFPQPFRALSMRVEKKAIVADAVLYVDHKCFDLEWADQFYTLKIPFDTVQSVMISVADANHVQVTITVNELAKIDPSFMKLEKKSNYVYTFDITKLEVERFRKTLHHRNMTFQSPFQLSLLNSVQPIPLQLEDNEKPSLQQHAKAAKLTNIADYDAVSKAVPRAPSALDEEVVSIPSPKATKPRESVIVLDHDEDISTSGAILEKKSSETKEKGKATGKRAKFWVQLKVTSRSIAKTHRNSPKKAKVQSTASKAEKKAPPTSSKKRPIVTHEEDDAPPLKRPRQNSLSPIHPMSEAKRAKYTSKTPPVALAFNQIPQVKAKPPKLQIRAMKGKDPTKPKAAPLKRVMVEHIPVDAEVYQDVTLVKALAPDVAIAVPNETQDCHSVRESTVQASTKPHVTAKLRPIFKKPSRAPWEKENFLKNTDHSFDDPHVTSVDMDHSGFKPGVACLGNDISHTLIAEETLLGVKFTNYWEPVESISDSSSGPSSTCPASVESNVVMTDLTNSPPGQVEKKSAMVKVTIPRQPLREVVKDNVKQCALSSSQDSNWLLNHVLSPPELGKVILVKKLPSMRESPPVKHYTHRSAIVSSTTTQSKKPQLSKDKVILSYPLGQPDAVNITRGDVLRLSPGQLLNDSLIEFGLKHWLAELERVNKDLADQVHIFNSFFYEKLNQPGNEIQSAYEGVRNWTGKIDIFKKKFIVIPINKNRHWFLAIIYKPRQILARTASSLTSTRPKTRSMMNQSTADEEEEIAPNERQTTPLGESRETNSRISPVSFYKSTENKFKKGKAKADDVEPGNGETMCVDKEDNIVFGDKLTQTYIFIFDSLGDDRTDVTEKLAQYLQMEAKDKIRIESADFAKGKMALVPLQKNNSDCGVFLLHFAETFVSDSQKYVNHILSSKTKSVPNADRCMLWKWDTTGDERRKQMKKTIEELSAAWTAEKWRLGVNVAESVKVKEESDGEIKGH